AKHTCAVLHVADLRRRNGRLRPSTGCAEKRKKYFDHGCPTMTVGFPIATPTGAVAPAAFPCDRPKASPAAAAPPAIAPINSHLFRPLCERVNVPSPPALEGAAS